jgi:hypothetical protein
VAFGVDGGVGLVARLPADRLDQTAADDPYVKRSRPTRIS